MSKLIEVLIAGFLFCIIIFFLVPMLSYGLAPFVRTVVIFAAIIYVLLLIDGYKFPWNKDK